MTREEILIKIENCKETNQRNSMGCNESWYNSYYAISKTFSKEELNAMSEKELNNLVNLADNISEALY